VGLVLWVRGGEWRDSDGPRGYGLDGPEDGVWRGLARLLRRPWREGGDVVQGINSSAVTASRDLR
jgi:hypothetical protein